MSSAEGYAAIPIWMYREEKVSSFAIMIYGSLATRAGLRGNFPSQATLAREARCSERKVRDALKELEQLGVIERVRRASKQGHRLPDGYRLMDRPLNRDELQAAHDAGGSDGLPAPDDHAYRQERANTPLIEEERLEEPTTKPSFAEFYLIYPRKAGKEAARKGFEKAAKSTDAEVIIEGARRFAADPNLPEKQFIPHPATWLNAGRWDDEPLPSRSGSGQSPPDDFGRDEWMYRA